MTVLLFVHGTGVREKQYSALLTAVRKQASAQLGCAVEGCYWGSLAGANLNANGASIPNYANTGGEPPSTDDREAALWSVLYADPLYELRFLPLAADTTTPLAASSPVSLVRQILEYEPSDETLGLLDASGLADSFVPGLDAVRHSRELVDAAESSTTLLECRRVASRAIVASTLAAAERDGLPTVDGRVRDELVLGVGSDLDAYGLGLGQTLTRAARDIAFHFVSKTLVSQRGGYTDSAVPLAGDVMRFLARPSLFAAPLSALLNAHSDNEVFLIGHSLGGMICTDLLIRERYDNVVGLITVGSQTPLLYEIGALPSLAYPAGLPAHVPPWLNIYDPSDALAYVGGAIFGGRVTDVAVDNRQPFPQSHSAYWNNARVWDAIRGFMHA